MVTIRDLNDLKCKVVYYDKRIESLKKKLNKAHTSTNLNALVKAMANRDWYNARYTEALAEYNRVTDD